MKNDIRRLLKGATVLTNDSRKVMKGAVFVAIDREWADGHDYISDAIKNGAKVIVGEKSVKVPNDVSYFQVKDSKEVLGDLASEFYEKPSKKLKIIGITGTKGKTTTSYLIYHLLQRLGKKVGLISSIGAKIGDKEIDTGFHITTPGVVKLNELLKEMADQDCEYAIIEVSSHAIAQKRIAGINFAVGVLTNIAPEHLDYHKTFKEYKRVKMSFINSCPIKVLAPEKTNINILKGDFNNINVETAIKVVEKLGLDSTNYKDLLKDFNLPKGRMEEVSNDLGIKIFIDFAHTPNSLEAALKYFKKETKARLISVFGCASERDNKKRSKMGEISTRIADLSIFTTEDSRNENIFKIFRAMKSKANHSKFVAIPERSEAIAFALKEAKKGDTVAFFGKGHERSMAYSGLEHPWNEKFLIESQINPLRDVSFVILAAGKGTRMKSQNPKVLTEICGRPLLSYTLENLRITGIKDITLVVSFRKNRVMHRFPHSVQFAIQKNPKGGTADAASSSLPLISKSSKTVVVMNGDDSAFYTPETIKDVLNSHLELKADLTFVTLEKDNPTGLGRVVRNKKGEVVGIVEEKNATEQQKEIKEVNDGLYVFDKDWLYRNMPKVKKNSLSNEYYIVDLIKIGVDQKDKIQTYKLRDSQEWQGVNTPEELELARQKMRIKIEKFNKQS